MVSYSVYAERRVSALIQDRLGPNRVGPAGLFQPVADAMKFLLKEDFTPAHVNKFYYWLAPCLAMMPAIMTLAVVPFGSTLFGVPMVIADINVGVLYVFAIASLGVYGIVIAGWSSNSKYPFLGGVRSSSQMISYELSLGLAVIPVLLLVGQLRLTNDRPLPNRTWLDDRAIHRATGPNALEMAACHPDVHFVCRLHDLDFRGNQPPAVRPARGRNRTGRRLSHGILLDEVRPLFPRRIRRHDHRLGHHRDALSRRLAFARPLVDHTTGSTGFHRWSGGWRGFSAVSSTSPSSSPKSPPCSSSSSGCAGRCRASATIS